MPFAIADTIRAATDEKRSGHTQGRRNGGEKPDLQVRELAEALDDERQLENEAIKPNQAAAEEEAEQPDSLIHKDGNDYRPETLRLALFERCTFRR